MPALALPPPFAPERGVARHGPSLECLARRSYCLTRAQLDVGVRA